MDMTKSELEPFGFSGTTREYYKVFFTNVALMVLTLGVYSAWAKVRNRRYFHGKTTLRNHSFDYDASPTAILAFRLVAVTGLAAISFANKAKGQSWYYPIPFIVALVILWPLLAVGTRSFNARHTIHRSVRFDYRRNYPTAYLWFFTMALPALGVLLLSNTNVITRDGHIGPIEVDVIVAWQLAFVAYSLIVVPVCMRGLHQVRIGQMRFGALECRFEASLSAYVKAWAVTLAKLSIPVLVVIVCLFMVPRGFFFDILPYVGVILVYVLVYFSPIYFLAHLTPLLWSSVRLSDGSRLVSTVKPDVYFFRVLFPNHLVIYHSIGLAFPWARVRHWRYLAAHTHLLPSPQAEEALSREGSLDGAVTSGDKTQCFAST